MSKFKDLWEKLSQLSEGERVNYPIGDMTIKDIASLRTQLCLRGKKTGDKYTLHFSPAIDYLVIKKIEKRNE